MEVEVRKLTVAEFGKIEFDDTDTNRYELIDGEIMKRNGPALRAPIPQHQAILSELNDQSKAYVKQKNWVERILRPLTSSCGRLTANYHQKSIEGVPRLVVKITSPAWSVVRDRITERAIYEQAGVAEYWLVDPQNRGIEVYALENGRYKLVRAASATEETFTSKLSGWIPIDLNGFCAEL